MTMMQEGGTDRGEGSVDAGALQSSRGPVPALGRRLGGDLPCVMCRYNLRGLSIRSVCPECGTPVRATILSVVDPHAAELTPIPRPFVAAAGLVLTAGGALSAFVLCWFAYLLGVRGEAWRWAVMGSLTVSAAGAWTLVRPHGGIPRRNSLLAAAGAALYIPGAYLLWRVTDPEVLRGLEGVALVVDAPMIVLAMRAAEMFVMIAIALLLRPNARLLVARSLVLRSGRVDRQTMYAIAGAAAVAGVGRLMLLAALYTRVSADRARIVGAVLVFLGSALVTLGLAGALVDCWRIGRSILAPSPTLRQVLGGVKREGDGGSRHGGAR